jgi:Hint domain
MLDFAKPLTGIRRSRRNLVKMGVIGASAAFASLITTRPVTAQNGQGQNNQGQNNQGQNNQGQNNQGQNNQGQNNQGGKCFLKGTTIRTADGNRKIEDLAVGDLLPTVFGGICAIQWIGHYPYKKSDQAKPWVKQVLPVRIARSALGPDMPHADLYVTKEHALLIDGVLVTAGSLINGTTIVLPYQARTPQRDLRRRNSLRNCIKLRRERGQFCRIPSSLWISNNPRGPVRAIAQPQRCPKRNKVVFPQCNLTLD